MARKVFTSFHYEPDSWRASKVRNIGAVEENKLASDNEWESVTSGGEAAIKRWIDEQMQGRSCVVVLIGSKTSERKWVKYEINKGWNDGRGVLGIYIHNITDRDDCQSQKGSNPFKSHVVGSESMASIVKAYDPPRTASSGVYNYIRDNVVDWIEEAIDIRKKY